MRKQQQQIIQQQQQQMQGQGPRFGGSGFSSEASAIQELYGTTQRQQRPQMMNQSVRPSSTFVPENPMQRQQQQQQQFQQRQAQQQMALAKRGPYIGQPPGHGNPILNPANYQNWAGMNLSVYSL